MLSTLYYTTGVTVYPEKNVKQRETKKVETSRHQLSNALARWPILSEDGAWLDLRVDAKPPGPISLLQKENPECKP